VNRTELNHTGISSVFSFTVKVNFLLRNDEQNNSFRPEERTTDREGVYRLYFFWSGLEIRSGLFLGAGHVFSNRPTVAIFNIEVDFVTFSKSLEAGHGD